MSTTAARLSSARRREAQAALAAAASGPAPKEVKSVRGAAGLMDDYLFEGQEAPAFGGVRRRRADGSEFRDLSGQDAETKRLNRNAEAKARYARTHRPALGRKSGLPRRRPRVLDQNKQPITDPTRAEAVRRARTQQRLDTRTASLAAANRAAIAKGRSYTAQGLRDARSRGRTAAKPAEFTREQVENGSWANVKIALSKFPKIGDARDSRVSGDPARQPGLFYPVSADFVAQLFDILPAIPGAAEEAANYTSDDGTDAAERKVVQTAVRFWPEVSNYLETNPAAPVIDTSALLQNYNQLQRQWWSSIGEAARNKYTNSLLGRVSALESNSARSPYIYTGSSKFGLIDAQNPVVFSGASADEGAIWEGLRSTQRGHIHSKQVQAAQGARAKAFRFAAAASQEILSEIQRILSRSGVSDSSKVASIGALMGGSAASRNAAAMQVAKAYKSEQMKKAGPSGKTVRKAGGGRGRQGVFA